MSSWSRHVPSPPALAPGKQWHTFLSYRSVNRPWVINLYDILRQHGYGVFLDQVVLKPSDALSRSLERGLERSQSAILVWSRSAARSQWVEDELEMMKALARREDFSFVPIALDHEELPLWARTKLSLSFRDYPDGPNGGELLRLLYALAGQALSEDAMRFASEQDEIARETSASIRAAIKAANVERLRSDPLRDELVWTTSSALPCAAAEGLTKLGRYDEALELLDVVATRFPRAIRPKQLRALALARRAKAGDLLQAQEILGTLYEKGERDPETVGIYARTFKDRWAKERDPRLLRTARAYYREGFETAPDDAYVGVNAAATSVLIGEPEDLELGRELAQRVLELVGRERVPGDYWATATIGEVFLLLGDYASAARLYRDAVDIAPTELGSQEATFKQACRLLAKLGPTDEQRSTVLEPFAGLGKSCSEVAG